MKFETLFKVTAFPKIEQTLNMSGPVRLPIRLNRNDCITTPNEIFSFAKKFWDDWVISIICVILGPLGVAWGLRKSHGNV